MIVFHNKTNWIFLRPPWNYRHTQATLRVVKFKNVDKLIKANLHIDIYMKHFIIFNLLFLTLIIKGFSQTSDSLPESDTIRTEFTDYVLTIKVLDTIEQCYCEKIIIKNPSIVQQYGELAKFVRIKVLEIEKDFSYDGIDTGRIQKIDLLLIPEALSLPKDTVVSVLLHRAYTYDYLEFDRLVDKNAIYFHGEFYAGNSGLYKSYKDKPNWFGRVLWKCHLINFNQMWRGKSKNQKNILRCIRLIKKQKSNVH